MNVVSPFLHRLFQSLDAEAVDYVVLRGYDELLTPSAMQEIDVLVAPADRDRLARTLVALGFVTWPSWGHAPHRFYIAYDASDDCWFKLDVVDSLRYGAPIRCFEVPVARDLLARRRRSGPTWTPASEDELFTLLLHCVLDKRRIRDRHRQRLLALWEELRGETEGQKRLFALLATQLGGWPMLAVVQSFDFKEWDVLLRQGGRWRRRLFYRQPLAVMGRAAHGLVMRRLRRFLFALSRHGTSTVLLAPDGGGKSTLAAALAHDPCLQARVVYMGSNVRVAAFRLPATRWLERQSRGRGNASLRRARPLWRLLSALHRIVEDWCRYGIGRLHVLQGRTVVYDRYFYDLELSPRRASRRLRARRWLLRHTCQEPDLVLLLDAPGDILHQRKGEHTPAALEKQRRGLLDLVRRLPRSVVIDTTAGPDEVRRTAIRLIWECRATRWGQRPGAKWHSVGASRPVPTANASPEHERVIS